MNNIKPETAKDIELMRSTIMLTFLCEHILDSTQEVKDGMQTHIDNIREMYGSLAREIGEKELRKIMLKV